MQMASKLSTAATTQPPLPNGSAGDTNDHAMRSDDEDQNTTIVSIVRNMIHAKKNYQIQGNQKGPTKTDMMSVTSTNKRSRSSQNKYKKYQENYHPAC